MTKEKIQSYLPERKNKKKHNYVDREVLLQNLIEFAKKRKEDPDAQIPDKIGQDIMKIAHGLSLNTNFARYTFIDDMIMDGIEDCLKAVKNYDPLAPTRSGKPNPFGYFTQIAYWAFVRRIKAESNHTKIRNKIIENSALIDFFDDEDDHTSTEAIREKHLSNVDYD